MGGAAKSPWFLVLSDFSVLTFWSVSCNSIRPVVRAGVGLLGGLSSDRPPPLLGQKQWCDNCFLIMEALPLPERSTCLELSSPLENSGSGPDYAQVLSLSFYNFRVQIFPCFGIVQVYKYFVHQFRGKTGYKYGIPQEKKMFLIILFFKLGLPPCFF